MLQSYLKYLKYSMLFYIYLGVSSLCFYLVRDQISGTKTNAILDAVYFSVVLTTAGGYEDLSPDTNLAILLSTFFAFLGLLILGILFTMAVDMIVIQQKVVHTTILDHFQKLTPSASFRKIMEANFVRTKCISLVVSLVIHLAVGTAVLVSIEDLNTLNCFYCVSATITSVSGSGKCFSTKGGRVFALFWMLNGTFYIGYMIYTFMEVLTQRRQRLLVEGVLKERTRRLDLQPRS